MSIVTGKTAETFIFLKAFLSRHILSTYSLCAGVRPVFLLDIGKHVRDGLQPSFPREAIGSRIERRASGFRRRGTGWRQRGRAHATSSSVFKAHWNWWLSHTMTNSLSPPLSSTHTHSLSLSLSGASLSRTSLQYTEAFIDIAAGWKERPMREWDECGKSMAGNEGAYGFYYCIFTLSRLLASTLFTSYRTSSYLPPLRTSLRYTHRSDPLAWATV